MLDILFKNLTRFVRVISILWWAKMLWPFLFDSPLPETYMHGIRFIISKKVLETFTYLIVGKLLFPLLEEETSCRSVCQSVCLSDIIRIHPLKKRPIAQMRPNYLRMQNCVETPNATMKFNKKEEIPSKIIWFIIIGSCE